MLAQVSVPFLGQMYGPDFSLSPGIPHFSSPVTSSSFLIRTDELPLLPGCLPHLYLLSHTGDAKTFPGKNLQAETKAG